MKLGSITIPDSLEDNLLWRARLLEQCRSDKQVAAAVKKLFNEDVEFAFKGFFMTYDPRPKAVVHNLPFILYPFQVDLLHRLCFAIDTGRDMAILKSRDMGASWLISTVFLWYWMKNLPGYDFLIGSRKEDLVDKRGDVNTLFGKLRYNLYRMPEWLLPLGFDPQHHDTHLTLINPQSGSLLRGEANNKNFGTGSRYRAVLVDEFAKWEFTDNSAWTSLGDTTPCRIANSTPFGRSNKFADLILGVDDTDIDIIKLHWKLHPNKDDEWYKSECRRRSDLEIAQELDLSFEGSAGKRFFREYNQLLHQKEALEIVPGREVLVGLDFGYHHPALLATQVDVDDRWLWHRVILGKEVDIETFARYCWKRLNTWFPHHDFKWYVDIAGSQRSDKSDKTSIQILRDIVEGPMFYRKAERDDINAKMREMMNSNIRGLPRLLISDYQTPDNYSIPAYIEREDMDYIHEGFMGGIHYPSDAKVTKEDWEKEKYYEHGFDAAGFIVMNYFIDHILPSKRAEQMTKIQDHNKQAVNRLRGMYGPVYGSGRRNAGRRHQLLSGV